MKSAALGGAALEGTRGISNRGHSPDAGAPATHSTDTDGDISHAAEQWAADVVTQAILVAHGDRALRDAVDDLQAAAEEAGLVEVFGQDEIQAAMALAF